MGLNEKERKGLDYLVDMIGKEFLRLHKDTACLSSGETEGGLSCFLGIDLHADTRPIQLSASEDWDIYASCIVTETDDIIKGKCRLPER